MAILSAMQDAAMTLMGTRPASFFGSSGQFEREIAALVNEAAKDMLGETDWQAVTKIATITGDGVTTEFDFPEDYQRMLLASELNDTDSWFWRYRRARDLNEWIMAQSQTFPYLGYPGIWTIMENKLHVWPAPPAGSKTMFPYISTHYAIGNLGVRQPEFTADADEFVIAGGERLLKLWLIWRWRENKKYDATGDQENYEKAFAEIAGKQSGSLVIRRNSRLIRGNVSIAYPGTLG